MEAKRERTKRMRRLVDRDRRLRGGNPIACRFHIVSDELEELLATEMTKAEAIATARAYAIDAPPGAIRVYDSMSKRLDNCFEIPF